MAVLEELERLYPTIPIGICTKSVQKNVDSSTVLITTMDELLRFMYSSDVMSDVIGCSYERIDIRPVIIWDFVEMMFFIPELVSLFEQLCMVIISSMKVSQMIWLSNVLAQPNATLFCKWIEQLHSKCVYCIKTVEIGLPVTHYSFITAHPDIFKRIKDPMKQSRLEDSINTLHVILTEDNCFHDSNYSMLGKTLALIDSYHVRISRATIFKQLMECILEKQLFPAICYQLSVKEIDTCIESMPSLLTPTVTIDVALTVDVDFDSLFDQYMASNRLSGDTRNHFVCGHSVSVSDTRNHCRSKSYNKLIELCKKGVGIYCSTIQIPLYNEFTKYLFEKGYISLLFCVYEPYMIHSQLRAKTIICTEMNMMEPGLDPKIRPITGYEYMKLSSCAGREGHESLGNVIHVNNLFRTMNVHLYKSMVKCVPIQFPVHMQLSHRFLLYHCLKTDDKNATTTTTTTTATTTTTTATTICEMISLCKKGFLHLLIQEKIDTIHSQIKELLKTPAFLFCENPDYRTFVDVAKQWIQLTDQLPVFMNKQKRGIQKRLGQLKETYPKLDEWVQYVHLYEAGLRKKEGLECQFHEYNTYFDRRVTVLMNAYVENRIVEKIDLCGSDESSYCLTTKGEMALFMVECPGIIFAEWIEMGEICKCNAKQLVAIFSCLVPISVEHTFLERTIPILDDDTVILNIRQLESLYHKWENIECRDSIVSEYNYLIQYDLIVYVMEWYDDDYISNSSIQYDSTIRYEKQSNSYLIERIKKEKGIQMGEFINAIHKIQRIIDQCIQIALFIKDMGFLHELVLARSQLIF